MAASVRPPPMSTTMWPWGESMGMWAPRAAARGSGMTWTGRRAPAASHASCTARRSTPVAPTGAQTTTSGLTKDRRPTALAMR